MSIAASDWRVAASYAWLFAGDRRCFAWEWRRRTLAYVEAWRTASTAEPFGLLRLEDPSLDARRARPLWSATCDRGVLVAEGFGADGFGGSEWSRLRSLMTSIDNDPTRHILFSDGLRSVRVDICAAAYGFETAPRCWHIPDGDGLEGQIAALGQLAALARLGRFARSLHPPQRPARRWLTMLRVHDAVAAGATLRDIVSELYGIDTSNLRWRAGAAPWRLRAQRLKAGAIACVARGPTAWLGGD